MLAHFATCIREGAQPAWGSLPQARAALEVVLAAARSAETGAAVRLEADREAARP
jgi:predicted dehydrogenase